MRLALIIHFLTFVVATANAAPESTIKPAPVQTKETLQPTKNQIESETVQATEAPPAYPSKWKWKSSDGSTNFGIGTTSGQFNKDKETLSLTTYHFQRTQYNLNETAQEFGFAITSNGLFGLDWGFKKFCCFTSFAESWKPYYKFGIAGSYDPKDQLGNFVDYQRYFGQASAGFESLFESRQIWRFELGARTGNLGSQVYAQIFYAVPD